MGTNGGPEYAGGTAGSTLSGGKGKVGGGTDRFTRGKFAGSATDADDESESTTVEFALALAVKDEDDASECVLGLGNDMILVFALVHTRDSEVEESDGGGGIEKSGGGTLPDTGVTMGGGG